MHKRRIQAMPELQTIHDRVRPGIPNQPMVFIFINNENQVLLYIPVVIGDNDIVILLQLRHSFSYHGCSQMKPGFLFLPHAVSQGMKR